MAVDPASFLAGASVALVLLLTVCYLLLCGDASCHRDTCVQSLHSLLLHTLPTFCSDRVLPRVLCGRARAASLTSFLSTAFEKFVMPLSYHALLVGGLYIAHFSLVPHLPTINRVPLTDLCPPSRFLCHSSTGLSFPPRTTPSVIPAYYVCALISWLLVFLSDPGRITASSLPGLSSVYRYDHLLFRPAGCSTCTRPKLARSKHCRLCNRCVARFDHHCGWLATCIGLYNIRFFLLFLALHSAMLFHGAVIAAEAVRAEVQRLAAHGYVYGPTGRPVTHVTPTIAYAALPSVCVVAIVFFLAALLVFAFFLYHLRQVLHNVTTNEGAKWDVIHHTVHQYAKDHNGRSIWDALREEATSNPSVARSTRLPEFDDAGQPVHIYDRGWRSNLVEVAFPYSFAAEQAGVSSSYLSTNSQKIE